MADTIKMRAKLSDDICTVKAIIKHPMETGLRKDAKTGKTVPAYFISSVTVEHNGEQVASSDWSGAVSSDPYVTFRFKGASKGDVVRLTWIDNQGATDTSEVNVR